MESNRSADPVQASSERSFGIVFCVVFLIVACWPLVFGGAGVRLWALAVAAAILAVALLRPRWLAAPNRLWFRFGLLLHAVVSPIALGVIFFLGILPTGLALRLFGKRPLSLAFDPAARSYWVKREPPGPEPRTMSDPF